VARADALPSWREDAISVENGCIVDSTPARTRPATGKARDRAADYELCGLEIASARGAVTPVIAMTLFAGWPMNI
jgi:hypothetical protein